MLRGREREWERKENLNEIGFCYHNGLSSPLFIPEIVRSKDKWIQRSVKRKGGSSNKGKENMVPYDGQPKGNKFIGSNEELGHQVPSGVLAPLSKKQNTLSPERSKIMQSHDHSNDGSLMDLEDNLEDEGEESTLLLAGNHKQFVPKIPSNLMLNHSKKQNTSNISFHYVVEEIISEEYVQHSDK
ncbi:uncharacterized protein LOC126259731 isoform X2 [Schistocerca nitens]|uniref:uncharacterized protein LOC126259731 isoform X2 n=1 Tax=Schistocerca nitens TaxID=7011 RepID=UPI002118292A|nr:uncharacterized protein LOC126259731 isoform X2 [Schistocerca nitens]